jgi:hypothetical protein
MLIGGDDASRVELTLANYTVDPLANVTGVSSSGISGSVSGTTNGICPELPSAPPPTHDLTIAPEALSVLIHVTAENPGYDIDLVLMDGDDLVARTSTPSGDESIYLAADALGGLRGANLVLTVSPCGYGPSSYDGTIEQGTAGNLTAAGG